jgi:hypothetical protein
MPRTPSNNTHFIEEGIRMNLRRLALLAAALVALAASTGCAVKANNYQPSISNVELINKAGSAKLAAGDFTVQAGATGATSITLRTTSMTPPETADYAGYIANALKSELDLAKRLDPKSSIQITGVLLKNDIAAGGMSKNSGEIEARFVVRRDGAVAFDKTKRVTDEWESSFAAAIAIPKAQQQYPVLVQKLLESLYADADFQKALR